MTIQFGWTGCLYKTTDESKTGATVANDSTLVLTLNASKYYRLRYCILLWANAAADFRFAWKGAAVSAGMMSIMGTGRGACLALQTNVGSNTCHLAYDTAAINAGSTTGVLGNNTTTTRGLLCGQGLIQTPASSPGTLAFQWSQITNTPATPAKVYAGSFLLYEEFT